jgi:ribonucleoside-diphosphate reductase alpha chain
VGLYENGAPGELFITMAKEGSTIGGLMDGIGTLTSMALQYGVPLDALVRKFAHQRFEPSGFTKNPNIRNAFSITDYVFRWMAIQFISDYESQSKPQFPQQELEMPGLFEEMKKKIDKPVSDLSLDTPSPEPSLDNRVPSNGSNGNSQTSPHRELGSVKNLNASIAHFQQDAPTCPNCGSIAVRNGACYKCLNCGESLGCS